MWQDPIVEEVRAIRDRYARQFDYDIEAIYRDLKKQEANSGRAFVSLPPKRIEYGKQERTGEGGRGWPDKAMRYSDVH